MADMSELGTELVGIMKEGLRARGWLGPIQVAELKKTQNSELAAANTTIENLETKIRNLRTVLDDTHGSLLDAYQKGSLSDRGCAVIAAHIEEELEKIID